MTNKAHSLLTGSDLHEPKGAAAAAANKVYVSNGSGSGVWQSVTSSVVDSTVLSGCVKLDSATASTSANISFASGITSTYSKIFFIIDHLVPTVANSILFCRASTDGGSNYATTGYDNGIMTVNNSGLPQNGSTNSTGFLLSLNSTSNNSTYGLTGEFSLINPSLNGSVKMSDFRGFARQQVGTLYGLSGWGIYTGSTSPINAVQFIYDLGTMASGSITMYGLRA